ncbi:MAG TPA: metal ABC transporter permease [Longimicrobiales bacterium]|nr:metal ABC transporter permease [Longimicrobiales bacterium]
MLDLMIPPIVAALIILSLHAYLGLHVIAREVIFVDLAFAQIAALGTTVALLAGVEMGSTMSLLFALGATLFGALIFSFTRMEDSPVPQEAIIGIAYVVASAAVILLAGMTAEGAEHIKETLTGTLIWVGWPQIGKMAGMYAVVGIFHFVLRRYFLTISFHPKQAQKVRLWDFLFYLSFGVVISFSVEIAGVLMVFSTLVIPAVVAFFFTDRFGVALVIAWASGTVAIVGGIGASFYWDLATGPLLVCAFGLVLVIAMMLRPFLGVHPGARIYVKALMEQEKAEG